MTHKARAAYAVPARVVQLWLFFLPDLGRTDKCSEGLSILQEPAATAPPLVCLRLPDHGLDEIPFIPDKIYLLSKMSFFRILLQRLVEDAFALFQILGGRKALFHLLQILGRQRALSRLGLRFQSKEQGVLRAPIEKWVTNRQAFLDPVLGKYGTGFLKRCNLSLDLGCERRKFVVFRVGAG